MDKENDFFLMCIGFTACPLYLPSTIYRKLMDIVELKLSFNQMGHLLENNLLKAGSDVERKHEYYL